MTKPLAVFSLFFSSLLPTVWISFSQAQLTCQSNNYDGSCVPSESCSAEHELDREVQRCRSRNPTSGFVEIPGQLEECSRLDQFGFPDEYIPCLDSQVDNRADSVGPYGKPNWVGAEFQSKSSDGFSLNVMWNHSDAENPNLYNFSSVQGYEIRIILQERGNHEVVKKCFCALDRSIRNISNIQLDYSSMANMIVEVRSFPSWRNADGSSKRRNCTLLSKCMSSDELGNGDCYSWPQNCLSLPHHSTESCNPPLYSMPVNVNAEMTLINSNVTDSDTGVLNVSWEPPSMMYEYFPAPNIYYVTIESSDDTVYFRVTNTTSISILPLNYTKEYNAFITAYVPCSGVIKSSVTEAGCGNVFWTKVTRGNLSSMATTIASTVSTLTVTTTVTSSVPVVTATVVPLVMVGIAVTSICVLIGLIILSKKRMYKRKSRISKLCIPYDIGTPPKVKPNINVLVFYPQNTELEDKVFIQTYLVATLSAYAAVKEVKSSDDPSFERGSIPESVDKTFCQADFVLIVCNSLFFSEWNCDHCSPSVRLLKRYMGNVSIRSDDSISKLITVILDEQNKGPLNDSRLNLASLKNFTLMKSTWESDIQSIVRYMTGESLFQRTTQEHSLAVLESLKSPDSPISSDLVPNSSQESHTPTPTTSDLSLSDDSTDHIACMPDSVPV